MPEPRIGRPYAKAHLDFLRRRDVSPSAKLVCIARDRLVELGEEPTPSRLAYETGLSLRAVQYALNGRSLPAAQVLGVCQDEQKGAQKGAQCAPAFYNNNRDLESEKGERKTEALSPDAAPQPKKTATAEERILAIIAPGGASERLRGAVVNSLAEAVAAGVSAQEVAGAIDRAGPGTPWGRIQAAARLVLADRAEAAKAAAIRRLEATWTWIGRRGWLASAPNELGRIKAVDVAAGKVLVHWAAAATPEFVVEGRVIRPAGVRPPRDDWHDAQEIARDWRLEDREMPLFAGLDEPIKETARGRDKQMLGSASA